MKLNPSLNIRRYLSSLASVLLLCGCDYFDPPELQVQEGTPFKNDWLVIGQRGNATNLNPLLADDSVSRSVFPFVFESLLFFDIESGEPRGRLARAWEVRDQGKALEFELRPSIYFHDGRALTPEDVVRTFQLIRSDRLERSALESSLKNLRSVKAIGKRRVRFEFEEVYFRNLVTVGLTPILPAHLYDRKDLMNLPLNRRPVGSGPYQFESWDLQEGITLSRFKEYWGNRDYFWSKRNNFQKIKIRFFEEPKRLLSAAERREIDFFELTAQEFPSSVDAEIRDQFYYQIHYYSPKNSGFNFIAFNHDRALFKDRRVRRALAGAIPYKKLNQEIYRGLRQRSFGHFNFDFEGQEVVPPYRPATAKTLLKEAGWQLNEESSIRQKQGQSLRFDLLVPLESKDAQELAQALQRQFKEIGVFLVVTSRPWSIVVKRLREDRFDAALLGWNMSFENDPYPLWHSSEASGRGSNYMNYRNAKVDKMLEAARVELDPEKRASVYEEFSKFLLKEMPVIFLFQKPKLFFVASRFDGVFPIERYGFDLGRWYTPPGKERYKTPVERYQVIGDSASDTSDESQGLQGRESRKKVERINLDFGPKRLRDAVSKSLQEFKRKIEERRRERD